MNGKTDRLNLFVEFKFELFSLFYTLFIPEVMKTGSPNPTFCVTFHNFDLPFNISLLTVLFTADVVFFLWLLSDKDLCRS